MGELPRRHVGRIDLLVQEGFYSNRTDLIRTAIRNQLATHGEALRHTVARRTLVMGLQDYGRDALEAMHTEQDIPFSEREDPPFHVPESGPAHLLAGDFCEACPRRASPACGPRGAEGTMRPRSWVVSGRCPPW